MFGRGDGVKMSVDGEGRMADVEIYLFGEISMISSGRP